VLPPLPLVAGEEVALFALDDAGFVGCHGGYSSTDCATAKRGGQTQDGQRLLRGVGGGDDQGRVGGTDTRLSGSA